MEYDRVSFSRTNPADTLGPDLQTFDEDGESHVVQAYHMHNLVFEVTGAFTATVRLVGGAFDDDDAEHTIHTTTGSGRFPIEGFLKHCKIVVSGFVEGQIRAGIAGHTS